MSALKKNIVEEFNESLKTLGMAPDPVFTDRDYKRLISEGFDLWGEEAITEQMNDTTSPIPVTESVDLSEATINKIANRVARLLSEVYSTPYVNPKDQTTIDQQRNLSARPAMPKQFMQTPDPDGHSPLLPPKETVITNDQAASRAADVVQSSNNPVPTDVVGAIMATAKYLKQIGHDESSEYLTKIAQGAAIDRKTDATRVVSNEP
jgi:hypothetical protein